MLNTEDSLNKRSYADFSIDYLLSKDYNAIRGTLRHSSNLLESENRNRFEAPCDRESDPVMNSAKHCLHSEVSSQLTGRAQTSSDLHSDKDSVEGDSSEGGYFPWLSCTRFKPPKLTRSRRRSASKQSGRGPRIPFSTHQLAILERTFVTSQYLSSKAITNLAENLQLTEVRVKIWFQNRRARYRRESEQSTSTPNPTSIKPHTSQSQARFQPKALPNYDPKTSPSGAHHPHVPHPSSTSLSKQSFRHLINDLNLMTANVSSTTSSAYLDAYRNHFSAPSSSISSKESCA